MIRNNLKPGTRKPVMVMLHGSGSSADIFGIQTHMLAKDLSKSYDLVYLDGPTKCGPGPGVLPLFADMPGYYRWITNGAPAMSQAARLSELFEVARHIQERLDEQGIEPEQVVAFLGFSQGALVALALLGLRHAGQSVWSNLRFCVPIAAGASGSSEQLDGIQNLIGILSSMVGRFDGKYPGFSVQAMGLQDVWYKDGRRISRMCPEERTKTMDYRDGHVVPRKRPEVAKLVRLIEQIDWDSSQAPIEGDQAVSSMPEFITGGDTINQMAFLSSVGIAV